MVIHARSLPEDVEAAPHAARANPLESLAVPIAVRDDVAHLADSATAGLLYIAAEPLPSPPSLVPCVLGRTALALPLDPRLVRHERVVVRIFPLLDAATLAPWLSWWQAPA